MGKNRWQWVYEGWFTLLGQVGVESGSGSGHGADAGSGVVVVVLSLLASVLLILVVGLASVLVVVDGSRSLLLPSTLCRLPHLLCSPSPSLSLYGCLGCGNGEQKVAMAWLGWLAVEGWWCWLCLLLCCLMEGSGLA